MSTVTVPEILRGAASLIRRGWSVGAIARNAKGQECDFWNVQACSWCVYGAIARAGYDMNPDADYLGGDVATVVLLLELEEDAREALRKYLGIVGLVGWSDEIAGSAEVIASAMEGCAAQLESSGP